MITRQMTVKQKAKQVAKLLRGERPDYFYLKELFRHLRTELKVVVQQKPKKLPYVPLEEEINNYYDLVWNGQNVAHMVLIKTLLYTGIRVGEARNLKWKDIHEIPQTSGSNQSKKPNRPPARCGSRTSAPDLRISSAAGQRIG
jgi:integrase/recombinase XerD